MIGEPGQAGSQQLHGYFGMKSDSALAPLEGPVPQASLVRTGDWTTVRDAAGLQALAEAVSDPTSANYRTSRHGQFAAAYGATAPDYAALINWAGAMGLTIDTTYEIMCC